MRKSLSAFGFVVAFYIVNFGPGFSGSPGFSISLTSSNSAQAQDEKPDANKKSTESFSEVELRGKRILDISPNYKPKVDSQKQAERVRQLLAQGSKEFNSRFNTPKLPEGFPHRRGGQLLKPDSIQKQLAELQRMIDEKKAIEKAKRDPADNPFMDFMRQKMLNENGELKRRFQGPIRPGGRRGGGREKKSDDDRAKPDRDKPMIEPKKASAALDGGKKRLEIVKPKANQLPAKKLSASKVPATKVPAAKKRELLYGEVEKTVVPGTDIILLKKKPTPRLWLPYGKTF